MTINPKNQFIDATRELVNAPVQSQTVDIDGVIISTSPHVFNPTVFFSSQWFAGHVSRIVRSEKTFIEIGCGTGIVSIRVAKENPGISVYATDINPKAAEITTINAQANNVVLNIYSGDVFDGLPSDICADSIFWSMPFGFLDPTDEIAGNDWQVFDPGYRAIRKFFSEARNHMTTGGRLLIGFSEDL